MFKRIKQFNVARENRRKLLKNLEEIKNEDLFSEGVEIRSEERLKAIESYPGVFYKQQGKKVSLYFNPGRKIQVHQVKRYRKRIPVRVGVA